MKWYYFYSFIILIILYCNVQFIACKKLEDCFDTSIYYSGDSNLQLCDNDCHNIARNVSSQLTVTRFFKQLAANGGQVVSQRVAVSSISSKVLIMMQAQRYVSINNEIFSVDLPFRATTVLAEYSSDPDKIGTWLHPIIFYKNHSTPEATVYGTDVDYDSMDRIILIGFFDGNVTINDYNTKEERVFRNQGVLKDGFIVLMNSTDPSIVYWFLHLPSISGTVYPLSVDVDDQTNFIFVSGFFTGSIEIGTKIYTIPTSTTATFLLKIDSNGNIVNHHIIVASSLITFTRIFHSTASDAVVVSGSIQGHIQCSLSSIPLQQCQDLLVAQDVQDPHPNNRDNFIMAFKGTTLELSDYKRLYNFNQDAFVTGSSSGAGQGTCYFSGYTLTHTTEGGLFEDTPFVIAYSIATNNVTWIRYFPNGRSYDCSYYGGYLYCARAALEGTYIAKMDPKTGETLYEKLFSGGFIALLDLQFDKNGNLFVSGHFSSNFTLDSDIQISSGAKRDGFLMAIRDGCSCDNIYCREPICYGKRRFDQTACSSRGSCASPNHCICPDGVQGIFCEQYLCNRISSMRREVCNGRGSCIGVDLCLCEPGYNGTFCENIQCDPPCMNGATCIAPNLCSCTTAASTFDNILFTGQDCSIKVQKQDPIIPALYVKAPSIKLYDTISLFSGLPFSGNGTEHFRSYLGKDYNILIQIQSNVLYSRRGNQEQQFQIFSSNFITVDTSLDRNNLNLYVVGYTQWGREFIILKMNPFTNTILWVRKTEMIPSQEGELYVQSVNIRNDQLLIVATCEGSFLLENCYLFLSEGKSTVQFGFDSYGSCKWKNSILSSTGFNLGLGGFILRNATNPKYTYYHLVFGSYNGIINTASGTLSSETHTLFASLYFFNENEEVQNVWFSNLMILNEHSTLPSKTIVKQDNMNNFILGIDIFGDVWIPRPNNTNQYLQVKNRGEVIIVKCDSQGNPLWTNQMRLVDATQQADSHSIVSLLDLVLDNVNNIYAFVSIQSNTNILQCIHSISSNTINYKLNCNGECTVFLVLDVFGQIKDVVPVSIANTKFTSLAFDNENSLFNISMSMYSIGMRKINTITTPQIELIAAEIKVQNSISLLWFLILVLIAFVILFFVVGIVITVVTVLALYYAVTKAKQKITHLTKRGVYANLLGEEKELFSRDYFVIPYEQVQPKFSKIIGEGSYGIVYELPFGDEICAAKVFKLEVHDKHIKEKVIDEIDKVLKLSHDYNIIRCIKILSGQSHIGYIMPKADCDLKTYLKQNDKTFTLQDRLRLLISIANGMTTLHKNHLIHRDLKPENVLMIQGHAKISDFDSCLRGGLDRKSGNVDRAGTFEYLAPECFKDMNSVSFPSDVYSFGVIMLQTFCGTEIIQPRQRINLPLRMKFEHEVIKELIEKCLEEEPEGRPTFAQLCAQLQIILNKL